MKKTLRIISVLAVLLLAIMLVACGGPDEIFFTKDNAPKATYVQGQDLDFTDISLSVKTKDTTENIPMTDPEISVTGYEKDTLGEQTVTVTYKELSTTFKVNVIPRMTFEGYIQNYFVGDSFNNQNGRIKVADNDAKISTINLKDDDVMISGFDSSTAGAKTLTVTYNGFTGSFTVNVLDIAEVKFKKPTQSIYLSHETKFNTKGAYITVTSTGNVIEKTVELDPDTMVFDFDTSIATIENRTSDNYAKQTVTLKYLGYTDTFDIFIRYSGVSIVKQRAEEMKNVDLSAAIDATIGENAIDAFNEYSLLSYDEKALLTDAEKETVAKVAAAYAYDCFNKEADKFSSVFVLEPGKREDQNKNFIEWCGYFTISCESYEDMVAARDAFKDKKSAIATLSNTLYELNEEFPRLEMESGVNLDKYFATLYTKEDFEYITKLFDQLTSIYEAISVVPADWTVESIKDAEQVRGIERAYARIVASDFNILQYPEFYQMINLWREKNDIYDIIHTHYLYNVTYDETKEESYVTKIWQKIPFPGKLNDIYNTIAYAYSEALALKQNVSDTSMLVTLYRQVLELSDEIKNGESAFYKDIYEAIDFDDLIDGYIYTSRSSGGYSFLNVAGPFFYSENFKKMWDYYFAIIDLADENGILSFEDAETAAAIENLFEKFYALSAYERYQFIGSLYSNYRELKINEFAFDYSEKMTSEFIRILVAYYTGEYGVLSEDAADVFQKILIATEQYGIRYKNISDAANATSAFKTLMDEIITAYAPLGASDKSYLGCAYDALMEIYGAISVETIPEITAYPELVKLHALITAYIEINEAIKADSEGANDLGYYALMFACYEKANELVEAILASDNAEMKKAYTYYAYFTLNTEDADATNDFEKTLEAIFDNIFVSSMGYTLTITKDDDTKESYNAIDYYRECGFETYFKNSFDVLYAYFSGNIANVDAADITAMVTAFRGIYDNEDVFSMFYSLNLDNIYYAALIAYFDSDEASDALFDAISAYDKYFGELNDTDEEGSTDDADALTALNEAWAKVTAPTDEALLEIYNYYLERYNAIGA